MGSRSWGGAGLLILLISSGCYPTAAGDAQARKDFKGLQLLAWTVDSNTGDGTGFAQLQLRPGDTAVLKPVSGYEITYGTSPIRRELFTDFSSSWYESVIPGWMTHGSSTRQGQQLLIDSRVTFLRDKRDSNCGIVISIPRGAIHSPLIESVIDRPVAGDNTGLEELLLAMAREKQIGAYQLVESYKLLKKSSRLADWVSLSSDPDDSVAYSALAAAAGLGDENSLVRIGHEAVIATGDVQVSRAGLLPSLPSCDAMLDAMLQLTAVPYPLRRTYPPNVIVLSGDTRGELLMAIHRRYAPEKIRERMQALIDSAKPEDRDRMRERMAIVQERLKVLDSPPPRRPSRSVASR